MRPTPCQPQEAAFTNPPKHKTSQKFTAVGSLVYMTSVTAVGSLAISHIWAVSNADVQPFLPYISDSGGDPPQSALFGFGVITTAIALMIIFSLRYITVKDITKGTKDASLIPLFNYLTFVAGLGVFLGLVMVVTNATGHLRRDGTWLQPIMLPHLLGASVFFVSGFSYLLGNSVLTWVLLPRFHNVWVAYARIVITLVNLISCILSILGFASSNALPVFPSSYAKLY
ncbi:DNA damage-regulated autophagy modulator protein 1 [Ixodes scapularis]|uniref:DNA damage-regulated autophagy modulator protein 1 n=1 Tax=Ixodes scapularis TaxID=6945 RepID=UPI001A9EEF9C|nr:DNA damage-regulated autophagy modulator protein 1 [Ixodes scapularis]